MDYCIATRNPGRPNQYLHSSLTVSHIPCGFITLCCHSFLQNRHLGIGRLIGLTRFLREGLALVVSRH